MDLDFYEKRRLILSPRLPQFWPARKRALRNRLAPAKSASLFKSATLLYCALLTLGLSLSPSTASAQQFEIKPVAEKRIAQLPSGPLFWRIDNFPTLAQAQAAAGPTALAAEVAGKAWLFTLGQKGGASPGGTMVAEIGPVPPISASEYLLRINNTGGPPGVKTPVHTHPGSETFYVLTGQLSQKSPHGVNRVDAGQSMPGHAPGMAMEISSSGSSELNALVMFVVDASKPFSSPATMP
jgi:quercetin dioxygenase-like cupin family protein